MLSPHSLVFVILFENSHLFPVSLHILQFLLQIVLLRLIDHRRIGHCRALMCFIPYGMDVWVRWGVLLHPLYPVLNLCCTCTWLVIMTLLAEILVVFLLLLSSTWTLKYHGSLRACIPSIWIVFSSKLTVCARTPPTCFASGIMSANMSLSNYSIAS